jgi:hypothetical protein
MPSMPARFGHARRWLPTRHVSCLLRRCRASARELAAAAPEQVEQNLSANVLTLVKQAQGHPLSPSDVRELLSDRGVHADLSAIRLALRRWAERNQIIKDGHVYRAFAADSLRGRPG